MGLFARSTIFARTLAALQQLAPSTADLARPKWVCWDRGRRRHCHRRSHAAPDRLLVSIAVGYIANWIGAAYEQNRQDALASDVFGSPAYVLDGEVFWGHDRIELLADALKSGRAAYSSKV